MNKITKKELSKYYHLSIEIQDLEEQIRELEKSLIGSPIVTGMPHGTNISNPVEQKVVLLTHLKEKLEKRKTKSLNQLIKIETYISSIRQVDTRLIFTKRYIQFKQWEEIAKEMCMSISSVYRKHKEELNRRHNENT